MELAERATVHGFRSTFKVWRKRIKERQREGIEAAKRKGIYRGGKKRFDDAAIWALADAGLGATAIMREVGAKSTTTIYRSLVPQTEAPE